MIGECQCVQFASFNSRYDSETEGKQSSIASQSTESVFWVYRPC
jgi:hypothetical protein